MIVGYARVSSAGQNLDVQEAVLAEAGCEKTFSEKQSGTTVTGRAALAAALDFVRAGDTLLVCRLDRLARSVADLHRIIERLNDKDVGFRVVQQAGIDTTSSTGKLTMAILGAVAEFETEIRKERQRDGIAKAKAAGVYKGRRATISADRVRELHTGGMRPVDIARELGIGRASVYRLLG
ncbi:recombinase family protein [Sphingomonas hengshuiensis]|uniref:Resolvase n=1 Tax=Sphingomonas hengshuiensis TaxID=1609977 RepID=A0A7U5BED1_9SPHN|nr:recombinase family protein [Sphingomonas hengshuiensis]AJP70700.1 resolvase [Sphingomonas hengshuiensis]